MARDGDDPGELAPGEAAGEYVITGLIAGGGGGTVYSARHAVIGREAAVKVLHRRLAALPKMVERFKREVQALNLLSHPGIVHVWEVGALADGRPFFAMELLRGRTVSKILADEGRLPPRDAVQIFEPVCEALAAAHAAGIIHRDVKASNIIVEDGPAHHIKLVDFGVAKLSMPEPSATFTSEFTQLGTATSMSPEQIKGGAIDARTDIYALGVLLYCLVTGRPPFVAVGAPEIMRLHLHQAAPRPSLRAPAAAKLDAVVLRCLEKKPEHRYASVEDLLQALRAEAWPRKPSAGAARLAAAMYVEVRPLASPDSAEPSGSDKEVIRALDASEDALRDEGVVVVSSTGNHVLGVRPLELDAAAVTKQLRALLRMAASLREELDRRERANGLVHTNLCLHVDEVLVREATKFDVVGGPLVRMDAWAPKENVPGVCVTRAAAERLGDTALSPGPAGLLTLQGPFAGP